MLIIKNYQKLLKMFKSTFPDIYNKSVFHEGIAELRRVKKQNKKMNSKEPQESEKSEDEIYDEGTTEYHDSLDRKQKNKIKSD